MVSLCHRLTDNVIELLHRLASSSADAERLKAIIESSKPHMEALESATVNSYERAQALVAAETKVAEMRCKHSHLLTTDCLSEAVTECFTLALLFARASYFLLLAPTGICLCLWPLKSYL